MSRKHFRAFAQALHNVSNLEERKRVADIIASVCAQHNPRFRRATFLEACGL